MCRGYFFLPVTLDVRDGETAQDRTLWFLYDTGASASYVDPDSIERVSGQRLDSGVRANFGRVTPGPVTVDASERRAKGKGGATRRRRVQLERSAHQSDEPRAQRQPEAGASLDDVVRVNYYLASRHDFRAVAPIFGEYLSHAKPAATAVICDFIEPEILIEIEVTARRPPAGEGRS